MSSYRDEWGQEPRCPECKRELDWQLKAMDGHIAIAFSCGAHGEIRMRDVLP